MTPFAAERSRLLQLECEVARMHRERGVIGRPALYLAAVVRRMVALEAEAVVPEPEHDDMDVGLCVECDARRTLRGLPSGGRAMLADPMAEGSA